MSCVYVITRWNMYFVCVYAMSAWVYTFVGKQNASGSMLFLQICPVVTGCSRFGCSCFKFLMHYYFLIFPVPVVGCLGIIEVTMIRSIMSRLTPPDKQGKVKQKCVCIHKCTGPRSYKTSHVL